MRFAVLFLLLACSSEAVVGIQARNLEMRTAAEVEAEGSCGCPAGHRLVCDGLSGAEEPLSESCYPTSDDEIPAFFMLDFFSEEIASACDFERVDDPAQWSMNAGASMYCVPL